MKRRKTLLKLNIQFISYPIIKWTICYLLISFIVICILNTSFVWAQQTYYIDSQNGNDNNSGLSISSAWKSHTMVSTVTFQPGDTIAFKKGSQFTGPIQITESGTEQNPITITSYGEGERPHFTNPNDENMNGNCIRISGSWIILEDLYFHDTPHTEDWHRLTSIFMMGAILNMEGADHNIIRNNMFINCTKAIQSTGEYTLITNNYMDGPNHALWEDESSGGGWGPMGIQLGIGNQEVSYNTIKNYLTTDSDYGSDGGAIELDDRKYRKKNIKIHHNYSICNQGFIEFVGRTKQDNIIIHHNVCMDYQSFVGFMGPCTNIRVENNKVVRILAHKTPDSEDVVFWSYFDNENIIVRNNIFYIDPSKVERVYARGVFLRDHNLYYRTDNPKVSDQASVAAYNRFVLGGGAWLGEGDKIGDPLFVDLKSNDFRLRERSPAIDAGVDLGYTVDFEDNPVPSGEAPDIGAYEYQLK